ncbi:group II intron maturase-specific domain-containing protein [Mesorhizobium sp. M0189]|uniref:group II intron maturase-specific domain-containing protein n=1 Tax=Mesorhizobium sp. M0189 TaxID=2956909 RepID=UPI00333E03D0
MIKELKPYLIGWRGYFGFYQTPRVLTNLEAWIRRRLRLYLWRQWGNGHNRFKELRRHGVPKFGAAVAAGSPTGFWRMSAHPAVQQACATITSSLSVSLVFMSLPKLNPIEPPWYSTDPYARWCGRGAVARRPPIPINHRSYLLGSTKPPSLKMCQCSAGSCVLRG